MSVLISAGPTHEPIDEVRYIANRSSGRMGLALAEAAVARRLDTTLLLGPTSLEPPQTSHLAVRRFRTTAELQSLLVELWPSHDVLLMAAAVADFRPAAPPDPSGKLSRRAGGLTLTLEPTPDLLAGIAAMSRPGQVTVGFALEPPERLAASAREKLQRKGVDAIVANPLRTMGRDTIEATVLLADGRLLQPPQSPCPKRDFADWLVELALELLESRPDQS